MSDGTKIEWTDATANVVNGCSVYTPGCTNCYAMRLAGTRMKDHPTRAGLTQPSKAGPVWTGEVRFNEKALQQVLHWSKPRMIFWNAHGDLFHENVPDEWIAKCFNAMAATPQHTHQVLTKRSDRMRQIMSGPKDHKLWSNKLWHRAVLPNVWLGVSVEDQTRADERIPDLLATPAAVRWISAEPLLGPVDLTAINDQTVHKGFTVSALTGWGGFDYPIPGPQSSLPKVSWVVAGGESGPGARPMHISWARSLRDQCREAQVPFLFKQWGEWLPASQTGADGEICCPGSPNSPPQRVGKRAAGRLLDGVQHDGYPA